MGALLALGGHLLGGGMMPDLFTVAVVSGLLVWVLAALARKRRSFAQILVAMLLTQATFHLMFEISSHRPAEFASTSMLIFHAIAGVFLAVLLAHGERLLFGFFGALRRLWPRVSKTLPPIADLTWVALVGVSELHLQLAEMRTCSRRRGPPAVNS